MHILIEKFPVFKHIKEAPAPSPADFVMPELCPVMYHFPKNSLGKLKQACKPSDPEAWVSTYDCIMALLWKIVTRVRLPMQKPDLSSNMTLVHAVNDRNMLQPSLPERFLGNAVSLARVEPMTVESVLAGNNLPEIASAVRASILRINDQTIHELAGWNAGTENKAWIAMNFNAFLGMNFAGTSWPKVTTYSSQDFGFGLPKAVRFPKSDWEGYVFVYPSRPKDDLNEGIEVCVCLEKGCQERFMEDKELRQFAHPRGL